jgi:AAA+ superfamily predicted ATPase
MLEIELSLPEDKQIREVMKAEASRLGLQLTGLTQNYAKKDNQNRYKPC